MAKLLAVASNNDEGNQLLAFAKGKMKKNDTCILLVLERLERKRKEEDCLKEGFATVVEQTNYLSKTDANLVEKESTYFVRNWYKFNKAFEKAIMFEGISLGFLSEHGIRIFFRETMRQLKKNYHITCLVERW